MAICMSKALSERPTCVRNAEINITTAYEICQQGSYLLAGTWAVYFANPILGGAAGFVSGTACIIAKNDAMKDEDNYCNDEVIDKRIACRK